MSVKSLKHPERYRYCKPISRFDYGVNIERSPSQPMGKQNQSSMLEQSNFTFERSGSKQRPRQIFHFSQYEDNAAETIAKNLIEENILLKEELSKSHEIIQLLEEQLKACRIQIGSQPNYANSSISSKMVSQLKEELILILTKNKMVEEELQLLRQSLPSLGISRQRGNREGSISRQTLPNGGNRCRSNSLDIKKTVSTLQNQKNSLETAKGSELIVSIKNMYSKITGSKAQSLKDLWRWLKSIGYTISVLKKWRVKASSELVVPQSSSQRLRGIIREIIGIMDC